MTTYFNSVAKYKASELVCLTAFSLLNSYPTQ